MNNILDYMNERSVPAYAEHPLFCSFEKGENRFLVDRGYFQTSVKDATVDRFSPWTKDQVDGDGKKVRNRTHLQVGIVKCVDNVFVLDLEGDLEMRVYSNVHPRCSQVTRKVAYILDQDKKLCSDVYYCYNSEIVLTCSELISSSCVRKRRMPSEYEQMKQALTNRTLIEAKKFLADHGVFVSSQELNSISRSVPNHIKTRKGRKPATNVSKLIDRYASAHNRNELMKALEVEKNGEKLSIIQLVAYPTAIAHYVKTLPYLYNMQEHKKNLMTLETLSPSDAEKVFGSYMHSATASGSLPLFGNSIFIDTTFSVVSGEYITIAVAITDQFKTLSGKNSSFLLALMIHSQKNLESHEKFSAFLNECLARESLEKRVPSIIHDGESSFRVYQTGIILKDSVALRCDIHRSENIKRLFQKDLEAFKKFKVEVFGRKKETPQGIVLKGGSLGVLSRTEYDRKLKNLISSTDVLDAKNWLINNANSLYDTHCSKNLKAAGPVSKEMRQRKNAVIGERSTLKTDFCYPNFRTMLREQQAHVLRDFALDKVLSTDMFGDYPAWVTAGDGKIHKEIFLKLLSKTVQYQCGSVYFVESDEYITKLEYKSNRLICLNPTCKKHRDHTFFVCIHMLSVFREMNDEEKKKFVTSMEIHRNNRTFNQVRFRTQSVLDGSKYTSRKGVQFSKNNKSRNFHALSRLSLDSTLEKSLHEIEENYESSIDSSD